MRGSDDTLSGWDNDDRIFGEVGNDVIWAGFGSDSLYGGDGNDTVSGDDNKYVHDDIYRLYGGEGDDELTTYGGVNFSSGGKGNDTVIVCYDVGGVARGGAGDDMLYMVYIGSPYAGGEIDVSVTLNGSATLGNGAMTLSGFERLRITTYHGDDTVIGGNRDDRIEVDSGANTVRSMGGDDFVSAIWGAANDLDGGAGHDFLHIIAYGDLHGLALTVTGTSATDDAGSVMAGFEQWMIYGSYFADAVVLGDGDDWLRGYKGADVVRGMGGKDTLDGDSGADTLDGGAGRDVLIGGRKLDLLTGGHGADSFVFKHRTGSGDVITDFASGVDRLRISDRVLTGGLPAGGVDGSNFHLDAAIGTGGQFVYCMIGETGQGALIWDGNGTDAAGEIVVALLDGMPVLTAADLLITSFD
ncbi:MAG: hypothetical protein H7245_14800 [Candidatus Saccharibacteria bacterium]|nr:hypothetical protein [Pseudorhodobacter sp.]